MLVQTLELYGLPENWKKTAGFYLEALADVPPDLVAAALKHVRLTCKWFPKPSELRAPIEKELSQRRRSLRALQLAHKLVKQPDRSAERAPISPETQAKLDEMKRAVVSKLRHKETGGFEASKEPRPLAPISPSPIPSEDDPEVQRLLAEMGA